MLVCAAENSALVFDMRTALIIFAILFANSAMAEWVNLWEERERLIAECGDAPCPELVPVLREIGLLDDALAAQEKVVAADGSVENRLLLAELQVATGAESAAIATWEALLSAELDAEHRIAVVGEAKEVGAWTLAVDVLRRLAESAMNPRIRYRAGATLVEMDAWSLAGKILGEALPAPEDLLALDRVWGKMSKGLAGAEFPELEAG
ncbi:MAG: hypothetical protein ACI8W8_004344 [Rhodothermales bacterium]|jgi:hypothetical protein